jgi:CYTH domain-containing protein
MAKEIERKFLVHPRKWSEMAPATDIRQGYICSEKDRSVRVRTVGSKAFVTIKGTTSGITRDEFEYEIPVDDANQILDRLCQKPLIEKKRYRIPFGGRTWEVDEFSGANRGLTVAEIELDDADQSFEKPEWVDREVSDDPRYFNANLAKEPFSTWK